MIASIIKNDNIVWLLLMIVTLLTWSLFEKESHHLAVYVIIFLSSIKVYLIGLAFMDVPKANAIFKVFFPLWITIVATMMAVSSLVSA